MTAMEPVIIGGARWSGQAAQWSGAARGLLRHGEVSRVHGILGRFRTFCGHSLSGRPCRGLIACNARFGRFAVPNLTVFLIAGQVLAFVANMSPAAEGGMPLLDSIRFAPDKVLAGEWWRLVTFLFDPPLTDPIFAFFFWYLFYLIGTTLEANWGTFRYNLFLLIGYVASIVMAFRRLVRRRACRARPATNGFLYGTVFLAFARLYPDFTMYICSSCCR